MFRKSAILLIIIFISFFFVPHHAFSLTDEEKNHIEVYGKAAKSVVNITSTVLSYDFFRRVLPREGSGTGIIIDKKGHILTNLHVIKNASSIEVTLHDKSRFRGKLVGVYKEYDLAVIRIDAPSKVLKPLPIGSSRNLMVGQKVLAIGNPFGLGSTLTTGIISSLGRSIKSGKGHMMDELIQTDASINPGNSGGPLLDSDGRLIGINTAIISPSGGSVGIGFAVPVDIAKRVVPDIIKQGYVSLPWLGVTVFPLFPSLSEYLGIKVNHGVLIIEMVQNGPAHRSGLKGPVKRVRIGNAILPIGGDVVVAVDGKKIKTTEEFMKAYRRKRPGDKIRMKILRRNSFYLVPVKLGEMPIRR